MRASLRVSVDSVSPAATGTDRPQHRRRRTVTRCFVTASLASFVVGVFMTTASFGEQLYQSGQLPIVMVVFQVIIVRRSHNNLFITSDKGGGKCFCPCSFVCLSVSKITKNACMNFDEILRVDRCRDMDELINFFKPDPNYSPDAGTGLHYPISYKHCYAEFYVGEIPLTALRCSEAWF